MKEWVRPLERVSEALALMAIGFLCANFLVSPHLTETARIRFLASGLMLGGTSLYFRLGIREVSTLHRAAYRIATTIMFWSLGYSLYPYPRTFLYLMLAPAAFFVFRAEHKARRNRDISADVAAAGLLSGLGALLYVEQQPLQVVLFPDSPFAWSNYYDQAPILLLCGLGLARVSRWSPWKGLSLVGTLLFLGGLVLLASNGARPWISFPVPLEVLFLVASLHLLFALCLTGNPLARAFFGFCGLDTSQQARFRVLLYAIGNGSLVVSLPWILWRSEGGLTTLPFAAATIAGGLYLFRPRSIAPVLLAAAALMFPLGAIFYPAVEPALFSAAIGSLIMASALLRRSERFREAVPDGVFIACAVLYVASLARGDFWSPQGLLFLGVLAGSWVAMPDRPGDVPAEKHYLLWPPLTALVVACLNRGYDPGVLLWWASLCLAPPLVASLLLSRGAAGGLTLLRAWRRSTPEALVFLSYFSAGAAAVAFAANYSRLASEWSGLAFILAVLVATVGIHLQQAIRSGSLQSALSAELFIWATLILLRWKTVMLRLLEPRTPLDGYALLAAAAIASGAREVVRRRAAHLESHLFRASLLYGFVGWCYTLWLRGETGEAFHAEIASLFLSGLFFWFAWRRARVNLIPAFLFANLAGVLLFYRLSWNNPQFYVLPAAGSALALAQVFRDELGPNRLKVIRLWTGIAALGTSSFYDLTDFEASFWYPLTAALVSALAVVVGISLRVRIYLYLGTSFFLFNTVTVLVHVIRNQPPEQVKLLIGVVFLVVGLLFTGSFLLFQTKRQQILNEYRELRERLAGWE